jgi:glutathione reductase (NADPH)
MRDGGERRSQRRGERAVAALQAGAELQRARFVDSITLAVGDDRLIGRRVLIAAGAMPAPLKFSGADRLAASEDFLNLDRMPARIVFVGGEYISFEFAHVAARAGADVTIVHRGARPLEGFDPDLVGLLVRRTRELGIRVELDTEVLGVDSGAGSLMVRGLQRGTERRFEADMAVHGAGACPSSTTWIWTGRASSGRSAASS